MLCKTGTYLSQSIIEIAIKSWNVKMNWQIDKDYVEIDKLYKFCVKYLKIIK